MIHNILRYLSEGKIMELEDIIHAINQGWVINWQTDNYRVIQNKFGQYQIKCLSNGNIIGLTYADGVTLNGEEKDFYIGVHERHKVFDDLIKQGETIESLLKKGYDEDLVADYVLSPARLKEGFKTYNPEWDVQLVVQIFRKKFVDFNKLFRVNLSEEIWKTIEIETTLTC